MSSVNNEEWEECKDCCATWAGPAKDLLSVPQDKECVMCGSEDITYFDDMHLMTSYMLCLECNAKWSPRVKMYRRNYSKIIKPWEQ